MNWTQFKDPVSSMCLAGTVVGSWSLHKRWQVQTLLMTNIFVTEFTEFSENDHTWQALFLVRTAGKLV